MLQAIQPGVAGMLVAGIELTRIAWTRHHECAVSFPRSISQEVVGGALACAAGVTIGSS